MKIYSYDHARGETRTVEADSVSFENGYVVFWEDKVIIGSLKGHKRIILAVNSQLVHALAEGPLS